MSLPIYNSIHSSAAQFGAVHLKITMMPILNGDEQIPSNFQLKSLHMQWMSGEEKKKSNFLKKNYLYLFLQEETPSRTSGAGVG